MSILQKSLLLGLGAFLLRGNVAQADFIYVANSFNNSIARFDSSGTQTVFANSGLATPQGLAFGASGNLYAANMGNGTIEEFDSSGHNSIYVQGFPALSGPVGLAFDASGNLYVGNTGNNTVTRCNSMGQLRYVSSGLDYPWGLACDSSGNLYVANALNNTIEGFVGREQGSLFASTGLSQQIGRAHV